MDTKIVVTAADHDHRGTPVSVQLDGTAGMRSIELVDSATQLPVSCQLDEGLLTWIENGLEKGATKTYQASLSDRPGQSRGDDAVHLELQSDDRLDIRVQGELFTSYYFGSRWHRPYFHPVMGPYGDPVTRGFPMVKDAPGETNDHPHHRGLYTAYGEVNGVDNWSEADGCGHTVHREFAVVASGPVYGRAVALSDWVSPDRSKVLLTERREMRIYNVAPSRLLDIDLTLTAAEEDVLFGDTKEGGLISLRVASSMDVPRGGRLENSNGGVGEDEVWGKRAAWCDYSGPVNGKTVGVAVFDHPESFRHPTYWHARDYGLMTTNPFAVSTFEGEGPSGEYLLPAGESLRFRYRIYIHKGDATEGKVAEQNSSYAGPPRVQIE